MDIDKFSKKVIYKNINGKTGEVAVEKLFFRPSAWKLLVR